MTDKTPLIALVGNPNTGKSALFNRLTGSSARVGNYPGMTVERQLGKLTLPSGRRVDVLDVPGTYSLTSRSREEQLAINAIVGFGGNPTPDLVIMVMDAGHLRRSAYLVTQVMELGIPCLLVANMIDEVDANLGRIEELFKLPCIGTSAHTGQGIDGLIETVEQCLASPSKPVGQVEYGELIDAQIDRVIEAMPEAWRAHPADDRAFALFALLSVDDNDELNRIPDSLRAVVRAIHNQPEQDLDQAIIAARHAFLDAKAEAFKRPPARQKTSDKLDRIALHPIAGMALFLTIMLVVFQALFSWSDPLIGLAESGVAQASELAQSLLGAGLFSDLVVNGLIGGVGNVIVFLPQILLLFMFIGLLEDSGYMARAAYLMDRVMRSLGLHGRAFVPMLSGFACAVPAIMATRTMERKRDRILTMMVVPLMTCSARLPVYTLIIGALFPTAQLFGWLPLQGLMLIGMYVFSTLLALVAAFVLSRTVLKGPKVPLILELPNYRRPTMGATFRLMWQRASIFLREAGTVIMAGTMVMWALLTFPQVEGPASVQLQASAAASVGRAIEPVIEPLGFDWKIGVGLIGAFSAREVFVSTMGIIYGLDGEQDENSPALRERVRAEVGADGKPVYTPLVGLSLLVFFALACQCLSTIAVVKRETRGWTWPVFLFGYMTGLAWLASFIVYQGGRLLGFS